MSSRQRVMLLIGAVAAIATAALLIPTLRPTAAEAPVSATLPAPYPVRVGATVVYGAPSAPRLLMSMRTSCVQVVAIWPGATRGTSLSGCGAVAGHLSSIAVA